MLEKSGRHMGPNWVKYTRIHPGPIFLWLPSNTPLGKLKMPRIFIIFICFTVFLIHISGFQPMRPALNYVAWFLCFCTALLQVYRFGMLLLQASPPHMRVSDVGRRLAGVPGVQAVHELHVWQLTESLTVASVHVHCHTGFPSNR